MLPEPDPRLVALRKELEALGAGSGYEFYIHGTFPDAGGGGEYVGLRATGDGYEVYFRERGSSQSLLHATDFEEARDFFVPRVLENARSHNVGPGSAPLLRLADLQAAQRAEAARRAQDERPTPPTRPASRWRFGRSHRRQ